MRIIDSEVPPKLHSDNTLLFFAAGPTPSKPIGHFNDVLHAHGLLPALGEALHLGGHVQVVPLVTDVGADLVLSTLEEAGEAADWAHDPIYFDGTFTFASKPIGHGLEFVEVAVTDPEIVAWTPMPTGLRRPVVALLDTGVREHGWLPVTPPDDPFLIDAEQQQDQPWRPDLADGKILGHGEPTASRAGHATFIAGLLRHAAPSARVLSVRVMNDEGRATESTVCRALDWLLEYKRRGNALDVICMAFGRKPGDTSDQRLIEVMKAALGRLAAQGVQIVASAGNDHQSGDIYPAAFDVVTAVGAGFGGYHANFSNFGDWVDRYRDGVDQLSIMPDDKWARWSGTSFAAANFAGDVARPHAVP